MSAAKTPSNPIARRTLGKTGERLSIIGFGGIVVMDEDAERGGEHRGRGRGSRHQLLRRGAQLRQRAGAAGAGAGSLSQELLSGLQDRGPHEGRLARAA